MIAYATKCDGILQTDQLSPHDRELYFKKILKVIEEVNHPDGNTQNQMPVSGNS